MVMHAIGFCLAIKDPFSDVCLKRPFVFHLPTDVLFKLHSPVFLDEEVCVCVGGGVVVIWVILILKFSEALILIVEENDSFCVAF